MPNKINVDEDYFLLEAVKGGKECKVKSILSNGYYRNTDYIDGNGRTALHWATEYGYYKLMHLLLDSNWKVNIRDSKEQTPLHIACNHRRADIATWLITNGCDVDAYDENGNTPIQRAIHTNLEKVVYLLVKLNVRLNTKNKNEWTPLHE